MFAIKLPSALFLCSAVFAAAALPKGFEVRGRLEWIFFWDGTNGTNARDFFAVVTDSNALIRANAGALDQGSEYSEFGMEGTNGFYFTKFRSRSGSNVTKRASNDAHISIHPTRVPTWSIGSMLPLWLAYASHLEFRERTNRFLPLLSPTSSRLIGRPEIRFINRGIDPGSIETQQWLNEVLKHLTLPAEWTFDSQPPHLVNSFTDYLKGEWNTDRLSPSLVPAAYATGQTNSVLRILTWTNVSGLHIPTEFQFLRYWPNTNAEFAAVPQLLISNHVTVTNISAGASRKRFVPEITKATDVTDWRFAERPDVPASYRATNGVIATTREEAWKPQREREERMRREFEARQKE